MTQAFNFQDIAAQEKLWNFFSTKLPTLFTGESLYAPGVFSRGMLKYLDQTLSSLADGAGENQPVALWVKHLERGDARRSSTSALHAVLFLQGGRFVARQMSELPPAQRSTVLETLGMFFLTDNLCENLYQSAEFSIMQSLDVIHFKEFSLLVGRPGDCFSGDFEEKLEELGFDEETLGLRTCVHAGVSDEDEQKQQRNIERAMELIHDARLN
jgi:hypothetical protein